MLSLPPGVRIFLCATPTDLRKSFDGLAALVRQALDGDPLSGHLYVFRNKSGDRLKLLFWDRDGLVIYYKRLEEGTFAFPPAPTAKVSRCVRPNWPCCWTASSWTASAGAAATAGPASRSGSRNPIFLRLFSQ